MQSAVAIGRGGLKEKKSMDDFVTPTGKFVVDLILYKDKRFNKIAAEDVARYQKTKFADLVSSGDSLARLFTNMNSIDFDGDGKSDCSYGDGYIGLTASSRKTVTGPKLRLFGKIPYWYSIALHGTEDAATIGGATSGGCVHLPADVLGKLISGRLISGRLIDVGTQVVISDGVPAGVRASGGARGIDWKIARQQRFHQSSCDLLGRH